MKICVIFEQLYFVLFHIILPGDISFFRKDNRINLIYSSTRGLSPLFHENLRILFYNPLGDTTYSKIININNILRVFYYSESLNLCKNYNLNSLRPCPPKLLFSEGVLAPLREIIYSMNKSG